MNSTVLNRQSQSDYEFPDTFVMHEDAGHGWLEVPYSALVALGITKEITGYSYRKGNTVYLEEDQDAMTFAHAFLKHHGLNGSNYLFFNQRLTSVYDGCESFIRSLRPF
jgi:hypothetical protein